MLRVNPSSDKIKKQKGQISVFVGLTFLILFTMFAMTVNVAMVVHDKINIQNAADFASVYVAQKQAEQLNAIAHMNYQIRQAHKLLTYRYIVAGSAGIVNEGEMGPAGTGAVNNSEVQHPWADKVTFPACIATTDLFKSVVKDNWCQKKWYTTRFGGIPVLTVVNGTWGGNAALSATTIQLGGQIQRDAVTASFFDWWYVSVSMASYRLQVGYRKALVKALAENLAKPITSGGMKDLNGEYVFDGARKTFEFNLTESNKASSDAITFQVFNSMQGVARETWLPEIKTWIALLYADRPLLPTNGGVGSIEEQRFNYDFPREWSGNRINRAYFQSFINRVDPDGFIQEFTGKGGYFVPPNSDFEEILGFEKNPWYMVYNQVRASAVSNALFNPTRGTPIRAQAFSKPFGGRVGPWYSKNWPSGSNNSTGPKTTELWSPRKMGANASPPQDPSISPNSPKYPGDTLGWESRLALTSTGRVGFGTYINEGDYANLVQEAYPNGSGNALARGEMRVREMAAVAPDLFDVYYYSVDSNFHENYLQDKLDKWLMSEARYSHIQYQNPIIWRDIGFSFDAANRAHSVHMQLTQSTRQQFGPQVFYALDSTDANGRAHLLTSWVSGIDVMDYRSPASGSVSARFGKCKTFRTPSHPRNAPGECLEDGGRTGYSVKMISKDYLMSGKHALGNSVGSILNRPRD